MSIIEFDYVEVCDPNRQHGLLINRMSFNTAAVATMRAQKDWSDAQQKYVELGTIITLLGSDREYKIRVTYEMMMQMVRGH